MCYFYRSTYVLFQTSPCLQFCAEYICKGSSVCLCMKSARHGLIQKALEITFLS